MIMIFICIRRDFEPLYFIYPYICLYYILLYILYIFFSRNYCLFVFLPSSPPPPMPVSIQGSALVASWSWSRVFASLVCRGMRLQVSPGSAPASPDHGHPSCLGGCQPSSPRVHKNFLKMMSNPTVAAFTSYFAELGLTGVLWTGEIAERVHFSRALSHRVTMMQPDGVSRMRMRVTGCDNTCYITASLN